MPHVVHRQNQGLVWVYIHNLYDLLGASRKRYIYSGEGEKLISGEEVLGIWSMCVTETEKFFPCGTNHVSFSKKQKGFIQVQGGKSKIEKAIKGLCIILSVILWH
jgi:hypothetical protein